MYTALPFALLNDPQMGTNSGTVYLHNFFLNLKLSCQNFTNKKSIQLKRPKVY